MSLLLGSPDSLLATPQLMHDTNIVVVLDQLICSVDSCLDPRHPVISRVLPLGRFQLRSRLAYALPLHDGLFAGALASNYQLHREMRIPLASDMRTTTSLHGHIFVPMTLICVTHASYDSINTQLLFIRRM